MTEQNQHISGNTVNPRVPQLIQALALLLFLVLTAKLNAQVATAQISGTVHDSSGAVIPGAQVSADQTATGVVTKTTANEQGIFIFPTLAVGRYAISVTAPGFSSYSQTNLNLTVGQQLQLNIALAVGSASQSITVTADAVAVDLTSPTEQSTVEEKTVETLPLNGRNPASITFTVAGVTNAVLNPVVSNSAVAQPGVSNPQSSAPSIHGSRPGSTYFSLDGTNNTDPLTVIGGPFPNPDATGEFSVVTGTYGAQYSSAPGGAINIVSRSGTNTVHGTIFEFIRNGYFNARNALSTQPDILKRNQFGYALGAPLKRDRLFVFSSFQATPVRNSTTTVSYLPTSAQRAGDFGTFQIPAYLMSPSSQKLLQYIPNGDPTTGYLSFQVPQISNDLQALLKLDLNLPNHHFFARGFYDRYTLNPGEPTAAASFLAEHIGYTMPWTSAAVGDTWTRKNWVFDSRASFTKAAAKQSLPAQIPTYSALGINNLSGYASKPGLSLIYVLGSINISVGDAGDYPRAEAELSENVFVSKGKHQLSFGADYRQVTFNETETLGQNPLTIYAGVNTYIDQLYGIIKLAPNAAPSVNPIADFIMGAPYYYVQFDGNYVRASGNIFGVFGEDNVKLSNRLTLTAGLRWDPYTPYTPTNGRMTCFNGGAQSTVFPAAPAGLLFPGDNGCPKAGVNSSFAEFQPRLGLAYQLDAQARTVVRAGYGRYDLQFPLDQYMSSGGQPWSRQYELIQPGLSIDNLWASAGRTNPFASGFQGANYNPPRNVTFATGLNVSTFDPSFHPAYVQQWSLSAQHILTPADLLEVAYNGTEGTHLALVESLNTPVYIPGASSISNENARKPYPQYAYVADLASSGTSSYHGVDITFKHRGRNFSVSPAFTWSKALDDVSQPANTSTLTIPNTNQHIFRGRSDFDQNLTFRTTGTWTSPSLDRSERLVKAVAGSWTLSGLLILDAGQPFSVTDRADNSYTGLQIDYSDRVPNVPVYQNGRLNLAAFKDNAPGTFGNSGRNAYRGPSYKDVDIAVMKDFKVAERTHVILRAESFNLFNHPNFAPPNAEYGSATTAAGQSFGTYSIARDPRIMQFSLKITF